MTAVPQDEDNQTRCGKRSKRWAALASTTTRNGILGSLMEYLPVGQTRSWGTVEDQRPPFVALTSQLQKAFGIEPDRELMATFRHQALVQAGLVPLAGSGAYQDNATPIPRLAREMPRILDTELIAIYW